MEASKTTDLTFERIEERIREILGFQSTISADKNLLELGLTSIQIMQLTSGFRKQGYAVTFAQLISRPTIRDWEKLMENRLVQSVEERIEQTTAEDMYEPFPLTEVQYAYWVGRKEGQQIGLVGCHGYLEIDGENVDPRRLEYAWDVLQMHHPMLRVSYTKDGMQKILPRSYQSGIKVYDYRSADPAKHLCSMREKLSHRLLDIDRGQVAELQLTLLPEGKTRIHFDIDLLVADVKSFQIILRDLAHVYVTGELPKAPKEWNFAEYLKKDSIRRRKNAETAEKYWRGRLEALPGRPELPLRNQMDGNAPEFRRRKAVLPMERWQSFRRFSMENSVTPAMALLTLYGIVLARWSQNQKFLMNVPLFNRNEEEEGIENVVADFTTLLLLEMNFTEKESFLDAAKRVQRQFHQDMEYVDYSGIRVEREYKKLHPETGVVAPIVFSCNLGIPLINREFESYLGRMGYMISQTPQVWLDFQLFDVNEGMMMIWDGVDEVFPEGLLDELFSAYVEALEKLAEDKKHWMEEELISIEEQMEVRRSFELVNASVPKGPIYGDFFKIAGASGDRTAVIDEKLGSISYTKLSEMARSIAAFLLENRVKKGDGIGVACRRGVEQIAAILGVLATGGRYVIVGNTQPMKRKRVICDKADIQIVLTDEKKDWEKMTGVTIAYLKDILRTEPLETPVSIEGWESAYVIFTSGTTGEPKGVEITHQAAVNTIYSLNQTYGIGEQDSVLAVSNTDFDLSVYDMFGMLSVGGKIVLLSEENRRNAKHWCSLMQRHSVTIWNSVPVLLDMLLLEAKAQQMTFENLRYVMQSGDWIGLDLPERLNRIAKDARFISMGGATEAAIWSNYQEVTLPLPKEWKTIPYGHPLPNQKYRVVNAKAEDCPDLVEGELWIGGSGVAKGYVNEPELTAEKFPVYKGERWYRTGDYGRFWRNGTIEFLGRRDYQVKIRGHRIELEEIENNLRRNKFIEQTIVMPVKNEQGRKYLAGFVVPISLDNQRLPEMIALLKAELEERREIKKEQPLSGDAEAYRACFDDLARCAMRGVIGRLEIGGKQIVPEYRKLYKKWKEALEGFPAQDQNVVNDESGLLKEVEKELALFETQADSLLMGEMEPYDFMLKQRFFHVDRIADKMPGAAEKNDLLYHLVFLHANKKSEKEEVRILEIGAGKPQCIKKLLENLSGRKIHYVLSDVTSSHLNDAREMLLGYDVHFEIINMSENRIRCMEEREKFDIILAADSLHREENVVQALKNAKSALKCGGILLVGEKTKQDLLVLVTAGLLEKKHEGSVKLYAVKEWEELFEKAGFFMLAEEGGKGSFRDIFGQSVFAGIPKSFRAELDQNGVAGALEDLVPEYMVPSILLFLEELPITQNGKIDRKRLLNLLESKKIESSRTKPSGEFEGKVARVWERVLHVNEICLEDDFYLMGGDSLLATQMTIELKKELRLEVALEDIFQNSLFGRFLSIMKEKRETRLEIESSSVPEVTFDPDHRFDPFPMTDIQQSYWIGRSGAYDLGEVGVHCYFEMDCEKLDVDRLEKAWNALIDRHEVMRAVMMDDGKNQRILETVPYYEIKVQTHENEQEAEVGILTLRSQMARHVFDATKWPLFDVRVSEIESTRSRLHLSFDNIVFDGFSIFRLFHEWKLSYEKEGQELPAIRGSFRDYVLATEKLKQSDLYQRQLEYWKKRVETMPSAPQLPVLDEKDRKDQGFTRFEMRLTGKEREQIKRYVGRYHLTDTVVFLTAYALVLGRYSKSQHFTLNLTRFQKLPLYEGVEQLIGDFTTLTLLEVDLRRGTTFLERCKAVQEQLLADMKNALVSGVVVEREWQKLQKAQGVSMPVVFTSGFGVNSERNLANETFGEIIYGESQTPQVWLDHQIAEQNGQLFLSWDAVCGLFPAHFMEAMFESYRDLIYQLLEQKNWETTDNLIGFEDVERIRKNTWEYRKITGETLITLYEKSVKSHADRIAIETTGEKITYAYCDEQVKVLSAKLIRLGVEKGDIVAILMEKGIAQIYATLAIMKTGAAYLPVDVHNPVQRMRSILSQAKAKIILSERACMDELKGQLTEWNVFDVWELLADKDCGKVEYPAMSDSDLAYVIFTSGSTGMPKGVMIDHRGAVNTILDVNARFGVTDQDACIFISNLNFDLSVYDIFGLLAAGGKIVIPDASKAKEPSHWIELLLERQVTVWNSVPAFLQMLSDYKDERKSKLGNTLRLILMSGDWIPVALPDHLKELFQGGTVISLGGATEASIWSNYFVIPDGVPGDWKSIPYGKPLSNQRFYVLNELMEPCPVWVTGELYIGGTGVAKGYCGDEERTQKAFISYGNQGEILYRTGDLGRYMDDDNIEFLGREDHQIKKNGHRIECGEIEAQIRSIDGVEDVVVTADKEAQMALTAHLCLKKESRWMRKVEGADLFFADKEEEKTMPLQKLFGKLRADEKVLDFSEGISALAMEALCSDLRSLGVKTADDIQSVSASLEAGNAILELYRKPFMSEASGEHGKTMEEWIAWYHGKWNNIALEKEMSDMLWQLKRRLDESRSLRMEVLVGTKSAKELLVDANTVFLMPRELSAYDVTGELFTEALKRMLSAIRERRQEGTLKVLEVGSRASDRTKLLLERLEKEGEITYGDESNYYLDLKREEFAEKIRYLQLDFEDREHDLPQEKFDLIVADNTLHRMKNVSDAVDYVKDLLAPAGVLLLIENTKNVPLMTLTTAYLEEGYRNLEDERRQSHLPMLSRSEWLRLMQKPEFVPLGVWPDDADDKLGKCLMIFQKDRVEWVSDVDLLREEIASRLPEYMVPENIVVYPKLPLSDNGKIDRKKLAEVAVRLSGRRTKELKKPVSELERQLLNVWMQVMQTPEAGADDNFFTSGGDSLKAIIFINALKESENFEISLQELFENPSVQLLASLLESRQKEEDTIEMVEGEL